MIVYFSGVVLGQFFVFCYNLKGQHHQDFTQFQCFRQTAPLRESRIAIGDGPQKNEKRADLALSFYKAAGLTQA